jgi:hypothetical protein
MKRAFWGEEGSVIENVFHFYCTVTRSRVVVTAGLPTSTGLMTIFYSVLLASQFGKCSLPWDKKRAVSLIVSCIFFLTGFTAPLGPGLCFQFPYHFTDGRTPWTSDQLVARPLPKHRTTQTQNKHIHTKHPCLVWDWSERAKTVHVLDHSATVTGWVSLYRAVTYHRAVISTEQEFTASHPASIVVLGLEPRWGSCPCFASILCHLQFRRRGLLRDKERSLSGKWVLLLMYRNTSLHPEIYIRRNTTPRIPAKGNRRFGGAVQFGWVRVNCCWPSLTHWFSVPGRAGFTTMFFCLTVLRVV